VEPEAWELIRWGVLRRATGPVGLVERPEEVEATRWVAHERTKVRHGWEGTKEDASWTTKTRGEVVLRAD
jgi:hypothetical protein